MAEYEHSQPTMQVDLDRDGHRDGVDQPAKQATLPGEQKPSSVSPGPKSTELSHAGQNALSPGRIIIVTVSTREQPKVPPEPNNNLIKSISPQEHCENKSELLVTEMIQDHDTDMHNNVKNAEENNENNDSTDSDDPYCNGEQSHDMGATECKGNLRCSSRILRNRSNR